MTKKTLPEPVKISSRINFAILYFDTEEKANEYTQHLKEIDRRVSGGYFAGMLGGRDKSYDHDGLFAVLAP